MIKLIKYERTTGNSKVYRTYKLENMGTLAFDYFGMLTVVNFFKDNGYSVKTTDTQVNKLINTPYRDNVLPKFESNCELYPFQESNVRKFIDYGRSGLVIGHDPGLGKTLIAGEILRRRIESGLKTKVLWVVPKNDLAYQLKDEMYDKFDTEVEVVTSKTYSKQDRLGKDREDSVYHNHPFIALSWGLFRSDVKGAINRFIGYPYFLVLDEVHIVNEFRTNINGDVYYSPNVSFLTCRKFPNTERLGLTGTPQPNGLMYELDSIVDAVNPMGCPVRKYFGNMVVERKNKLQANTTGDYLKEVEKIQESVDGLHQSYLMANMIRKTKEEVSDQLPDIIEVKFPVEFNDKEEEIYENLKQIFLDFVTEKIPSIQMTDMDGRYTEEGIAYNSVRMLLWQAMRFYSSYGTKYILKFLGKILDESVDEIAYCLLRDLYRDGVELIAGLLENDKVRDFPKLEVLLEWYRKYMRERGVIFANRVDSVIEIAKELKKSGIDCRVILGRGNQLSDEDAKMLGQKKKFDDDSIQSLLKWFWFPWSNLRDLANQCSELGIDFSVFVDEKVVKGSATDYLMNIPKNFQVRIKWDKRMPTDFVDSLYDFLVELGSKNYYLVFKHKKQKFLTASGEEFLHFIREPNKMRTDKRVLAVTDVLMEGVNLQIAETLVFYDYPLSIRQREQRLSRVHRIGSVTSNIVLVSVICGLERSISYTLKEKYQSGKSLKLRDPTPVKISEVIKHLS
jgi:ERCC4-related helicase